MTYVKRRLFIDFEKEEKFLNDMMAKGLALKNYSWGKYTFEKAPKGEYIYRLELLEHPPEHEESQNYISFMEEMGAELIITFYRWAYFRKNTADGEFDIYSDLDSRIKHYTRVRMFILLIAAFNFFMGLLNVNSGHLATSTGYPPINNYVAIVSFSVAALLLIMVILPLTKKINNLDNERKIRE